MATTFKTFLNDDVASTRTLLHEAIPVTGSLLFGTYGEYGTSTSNIKQYTHGMFQSVYDYTYTKSSANHIFDLTVGYSSSPSTGMTVTSDTYKTKKQMIYNEFAKILQGHDTTGAIRKFDEDGKLDAGDKINEAFIISVARLLNKDEIKKGSFYIDLDVSQRLPVAGVCSGDAAVAAAGSITFTGVATADDTVTIISTDGTSKTYTAKATADVANNQFSVATSAAANATSLKDAIVHASGHNGKITVVDNASGALTLTQAVAGSQGNTTITEALTNASAVSFTSGENGERYELRITDEDSLTSYKVNSPAGDYGILKLKTYSKITLNDDATCTDNVTTTIDFTVAYTTGSGTGETFLTANSDSSRNHTRFAGLIFYQAGVVVLNPLIFERYNDATDALGGYQALGSYHGKLPLDYTNLFAPDKPRMSGTTTVVEDMLEAESIDACATALRKRINKIAFNNTTELNSTIYFCRAGHNDFNYSSNPTYLADSKIRVKEESSDAPVAYITSVGLYSADNELLAVAKLSEPLRKDPTNEMVLRVRLDY